MFHNKIISNASRQIVNKAGNFAPVLRGDGLSYMAYRADHLNPPLTLQERRLAGLEGWIPGAE